MTGFRDIFVALKPTAGGNIVLQAVMGPDTNRFANLEPVNAATTLRGNVDPRSSSIDDLVNDTADALTADVWNIFYIGAQRLANQKIYNLE